MAVTCFFLPLKAPPLAHTRINLAQLADFFQRPNLRLDSKKRVAIFLRSMSFVMYNLESRSGLKKVKKVQFHGIELLRLLRSIVIDIFSESRTNSEPWNALFFHFF